MTRIIGGSAGGRRLRTPPGDRTRPTSDRVREALFSAWESRLGSLHGLRVLDAYAGSGAIGLEALSRGARAATLIESDRRTAALIKRNTADLGLGGADVIAATVGRVVQAPATAPYDVVFCDPPYDVPNDRVAAELAAMAGNGWFADDASVVVERESRDPAPEWPPGCDLERRRDYGGTTLWFLNYRDRESPDEQAGADGE